MKHLSGIPSYADLPWDGSETVDISTTDHAFACEEGFVRGLLITGSGDVTIRFLDGTEQTIPVAVETDHHFELRGYLITHVIRATTDATVLCGLL